MSKMFIHLPRTGGTFLRVVLEEFGIPHNNHYPVVSLCHSSLTFSTELFTFGFIRNPYDWYVSRYFYYCRKGVKEKGVSRDNDMGISPGFGKEIKSIYQHIKLGLESDAPRFWLSDIYDYMYKVDGKLAIDYVGKFEDLENEVRKILGLTRREFNAVADKHRTANLINASKHQGYLSHLSDETMRIIYEKDKEIFDEYGYAS